MKNVRNSNIELLRMTAALFVIVLHYNNVNNGAAFLYTSTLGINYRVLFLLEICAICAVNVFVMISGYYMCNKDKVNFQKPVLLLLSVVSFRILRYIATCFISQDFTVIGLVQCFISMNWYAMVYIALYLISPFLNVLIRTMSQKKMKMFIILTGILFSMYPTALDLIQSRFKVELSSLYTLGTFGSGSGYTIVNFVLMYFIGAYLRKYSLPKLKWPIIYVVLTAMLLLFARISFNGSLSYCNPLNILQAVALFKTFENISLQSRVINLLASASFTVYLMHTFFLKYCMIEKFTTSFWWLAALHCVATCIIVYLFCFVIHVAYQNTLYKIFERITNRLKYINISV